LLAAFGLAVGYGDMAAAQTPFTIRYGVERFVDLRYAEMAGIQ
jgi:hypothetical protein